MQSILLTPTLCELIKSFRIRNEKTAKDICTTIGKTPSYLSKIESGATKKIDSSVFQSLCNAVSDSSEGIKAFITFAFQDDTEYDKETLLTLSSIDDVLYTFIPTQKILDYINQKMNAHNLTIDDLVSELNANTDIINLNLSDIVYNSLPINTYAFIDDEKNHSVIKLSYSYNTINNVLNNSDKTNYITLEALLYSLYKLCGESTDESRIKAIETLNDKFNISSIRKTKTIVIKSKEDEEKYFGKLEANVEENFRKVMQGMRIALLLSQSKGGADRIDTLNKNLKTDLGFTFSFISTDLKNLFPLSKEAKRDFIKDLNKLIAEYSNKTDKNIDFFFDK